MSAPVRLFGRFPRNRKRDKAPQPPRIDLQRLLIVDELLLEATRVTGREREREREKERELILNPPKRDSVDAVR